MIIVEVESTVTQKREGGSGADAWVAWEQQIVVHGMVKGGFASRYPVETVVRLDSRDPKPFNVGKYVVAATSFKQDKYGKLEMAYLNLQPFSEFLAELGKQIGGKFVFDQPKAA